MMEAAPPSYQTATSANHWGSTARYLSSRDLCSAALVCSKWHTTFTPHLWGNPASHFSTSNNAVYIALTRFLRVLKTARLTVRALTHTLHVPPAHAESYDGPHADWLREVLETLPNLQSLVVRGLPFFDHAALQALRFLNRDFDARQDVRPAHVGTTSLDRLAFQRPVALPPSSGLRLLDASRCPDVTSHGLAQALRRFESLMYLDLSFTSAARDSRVLEAIRTLVGLQVLKMRGLGLKDDGIECLGRSIGLHVRSLDVRDNLMSDHGVTSLLENCFINQRSTPSESSTTSLLSYLGSEMLEVYQGENFEGFLRHSFTKDFVPRLAIEDVPHSGITHLYITGNQITVQGISSLLNSERLHVLDVGTIESGVPIHGASPDTGDQGFVPKPGAESLTLAFSTRVTRILSFLRIHHSLVTRDDPTLWEHETVRGQEGLRNASSPHSLPIIDPSEGSPRADPSQPTVDTRGPRDQLTGVQKKPKVDGEYEITEGEAENQAILEGILIPEAVSSPDPIDDRSGPLETPNAPEGTTERGWSANASSAVSSAQLTLSSRHESSRVDSAIGSERETRLYAHTESHYSLHPGMVPHVATLVLTDLPALTADSSVADRLILFVKQCAEEATHARKQALTDYTLPPGRQGHVTALRESERRTFALQRLVLELAAEPESRRVAKASLWRHQDMRSMTGDRDSEALWAASETDFSFFDEDRDPASSETDVSSFHVGLEEKDIDHEGLPICKPQGGRPRSPEPPRYDVVSLLSAFRRDRKAANDRDIVAGNTKPETEGFWSGSVQVVRPKGNMRGDEDMDYYGEKYNVAH